MDSYRNVNAVANPDADTYAITNAYPVSDVVSVAYAHADAYADAHYTHVDQYAALRSDPDNVHAVAHPDADVYAHPKRHAHAVLDMDGLVDVDPDTNANPDDAS